MEWLTELANTIWQSFVKVVSYPLDQTQRVYIPYLVTSLLIAVVLFLVASLRASKDEQQGSIFVRLFRFLFPAEIWRHRSSWVDVRYFIPHQMVRIWIYTSLVTLLSAAVMKRLYEALEKAKSSPGPIFDVRSEFVLAIAYTLVSIVVADFLSFLMHYLQHKVPILWEFHKVHHSAEVLNPLTNYREHPVDNVAYAVVLGCGTGATAAVFASLFWVGPSIVQVFGINAVMFVYNVSGYHLRHSHVWLRWPGPLAYLFGCPAHHQIHHSCKPQHINKNMAFMFPIWDVLFGTFHLPKQQEEMQFGIGDGTEGEYRSFLGIYFRPFVELFRDKPSGESTEEKSPRLDSAITAPEAEDLAGERSLSG